MRSQYVVKDKESTATARCLDLSAPKYEFDDDRIYMGHYVDTDGNGIVSAWRSLEERYNWIRHMFYLHRVKENVEVPNYKEFCEMVPHPYSKFSSGLVL